MDPRQAVFGQRQAPPEWRCDPQRVKRGARVMEETRQGQLGRTQPAAGRIGPLQHKHRAASARQGDRGRQAVWPGADDDGIVAVAPGPTHVMSFGG